MLTHLITVLTVLYILNSLYSWCLDGLMVIFSFKALLKNKDLCCSGIFLLSYHITQITLEGHGLQVNQKWKMYYLVYLRKAK